MNERTNEQVNEQTNEWINEWTSEQMKYFIYTRSTHQFFIQTKLNYFFYHNIPISIHKD